MTHQENRELLLLRAREACESPGVYLMKDVAGAILYVGKAKNLRNRLLSYFKPALHEMPRIERLVQTVDLFEMILTETEAEALLLEATLIKKHQPKFNIRLKDDKAYPYLKIQLRDGTPRMVWTRTVLKDGARYFGPFPSAWAARQVLGLVNEKFRLRDCSDNTFSHRSRPCILYQMDRCTAPCVGKISDSDYRADVQRAIDVLEGRGSELIAALRSAMDAASEQEEFEEAGRLRDQLQSLALITETQTVHEAGRERDRDVVSTRTQGTIGHGVLLKIRKGVLVGVEHFRLQGIEETIPSPEVLRDFLMQIYLRNRDEGDQAAKDILVAEEPADAPIVEEVLGCPLRKPETAFELQLMNVAQANADHAIEQQRRRDGGHGLQALEDTQKLLNLVQLPLRIECFDVSNIQSDEPVASRVVFIEGVPDKNLYRRYKIKTVEGQNDFAMMKEVLSRRFKNTIEDLPQLIVVDGGKGQLAQASEILKELDIQGVEAVGLAKARTESDFQSSEVKTSSERVFLPNRKNPVVMRPGTSVFGLLVHVRDEAHRFAVSYHRLRRRNKNLGKKPPVDFDDPK